MAEETGRIPTSLRGLLVLEALAAADRPLRLSELGQMLGLPKQTAHRICAVLLREGFLRRDPDRRLSPGVRLQGIARRVLLPDHRRVARRRILEQVSAAFGETTNLVVPEPGGMAYVDRVETQWPLRIQLPVGSLVPFHCTASGKMYLSTLGKSAQRRLLAALPLERSARNTLTDPAALRRALREIAARGYSTDDEEMVDGMVALAVAVRDPEGRFLAALAVHGPLPRFSLERAVERVAQLTEAGRELAAVLTDAADRDDAIIEEREKREAAR